MFPDITIHGLINEADVAGVGRFMTQPNPTNNYVEVIVDEYWTSGIPSNTLLIGTTNKSNWNFPTNTPIVFFAMKFASYWSNGWINVSYLDDIFEQKMADTSLSFPDGDRAWFVKTQDNGLLFDYTTNLWECVRVNPNMTNEFNAVLAGRHVSTNISNRVRSDSGQTFLELSMINSPEFLVEMHSRTDITNNERDLIYMALANFHKWEYENGIWTPPAP